MAGKQHGKLNSHSRATLLSGKASKSLEKSLKELFTSNKNPETETKRVLGDLNFLKVTNYSFMFLKKPD